MSAFDHAVFRLLLDEYLKDVFERESHGHLSPTPDLFELSLLESCLQDLDGRVTFYYRRYAPDLYDPEEFKNCLEPLFERGVLRRPGSAPVARHAARSPRVRCRLPRTS